VVYRGGKGCVAAEHRPSSNIYGALVATHCSDRFYRHLEIRPIGKSDRCSGIRTMREVNWSLLPEFFRVFLGWSPVVLTSALIFFAHSTWRSGDEGGRHRCRTHREGPSGWSVSRLGRSGTRRYADRRQARAVCGGGKLGRAADSGLGDRRAGCAAAHLA
jgi:hypothetical protein